MLDDRGSSSITNAYFHGRSIFVFVCFVVVVVVVVVCIILLN